MAGPDPAEAKNTLERRQALASCAGAAPSLAISEVQRVRVLVVSDTRLLRDGIALAIRHKRCLESLGATEAVDAPAVAASRRPDVVLLDADAIRARDMPRLLKELVPGLHIVVFAIADGEPDILGWAEAGTSGYVGHDGTIDNLVAAIKGAMRGEVFCSPRLIGLLFSRVAELKALITPTPSAAKLTPREREVMAFVEQGLPNKEIARRLGIGHATVKNHVHHLLEKMNARGRGEAAARMRCFEEADPAPQASAKPCSTAA